MKIQLKGGRFEDFTEIQAHLQVVLDSIVEWEFFRCFQLFNRNRCARYINSEGDYFDGTVRPHSLYIELYKSKAIPIDAWTGADVSRRLRFPDYKTIGTLWRQVCQPYAQTSFTGRK
jgi:hypothetical protein